MYDATEKLKSIAAALRQHRNILIPDTLRDALDSTCKYLLTYRTPSPPPILPHTSGIAIQPGFQEFTPTHSPDSCPPDIQYNVKLSTRTTLDVLYVHKPGTTIEYPQTSATGRIGHLFQMDIHSNWVNPARNFAYSQGEPRGSSGSKAVSCRLLVDDLGKEVLCRESHSTCQGTKICPFGDLDTARLPHCSASRNDLQQHLAQESLAHTRNSPEKELFEKTLAFFVAIKKHGCGTPISAPNIVDLEEVGTFEAQLMKARRGHSSRPTCRGKILFEYARDGRPVLRCELYHPKVDKDHFVNFDVGHGFYERRYLEALFRNDLEVIAEYEEDAATRHGVGPRTACNSVINSSAIQVNCTSEHRDGHDKLIVAELIRLECHSRFRIFEPFEEYRAHCPRVLVICHGAHNHPIPLPSKTPPGIRKDIFDLLQSLNHDLPDLTPRRFLRHPTTHAFLKGKLPDLTNPTMIDLHPSLGNKDHLRSFILKAQELHFPSGTGWEGILHLKDLQDRILSSEEAYIRVVLEIPHSEMIRMSTVDEDLEDDADNLVPSAEVPFRMVVCMSVEASAALLSVQYLQSDIGFKRVVGFKEFELGGLDPKTRTSITYCRIYLNRQNAIAHRLIFETIDQILLQDTGQTLCWRHLHANSLPDNIGILQFSVDQHGGQAKGLGMYLVRLAQKLPPRQDLHEPHRQIQELDEYEHLRRILRLCENHFFRNIKKTQVPENIRSDMRSLVCIQHADWEGTLKRIELGGGKAGKDWLNDKSRAKFVFPAICWEKSFIPRIVWQVGDRTTNIIEEVHSDVNREGVSCTLVGGVKKGQYFDNLKFKTIKNICQTGINPYYQVGTLSHSVARSLKRKARSRHKVLAGQDAKIEQGNKKVKLTHEAMALAQRRLQSSHAMNMGSPSKILAATQRASRAHDKAIADSLQNIGMGSGKVGILLPRDISYIHKAPSSM